MNNALNSETFFSEEEKKRIEQTTHEVEGKTTGEVNVMVVGQSDRYIEAEVIGGVLFGSFLAFLAAVFFLNSSLWAFVPLAALFYFPAKIAVLKTPELKRAFMGRGRMEEEVRERAIRAFYEKGLYKTRQNTGILFFLSLFEHKVWVLADKGIYEKIRQETLNRFAESVSRGIGEGRACDSLCENIREAGDLLAKHFPMAPGDTDELSNKVMTE